MNLELSMTWALPECADTRRVGGVWDSTFSYVAAARHYGRISGIMLCYAIAAL